MKSGKLSRKFLVLVASICLIILDKGGAAVAAETDWKIGIAQVKITPSQPIFLAGYASRNKPYTRIETDLFAKALVIEDGAGHRAVLVTSDPGMDVGGIEQDLVSRRRAGP